MNWENDLIKLGISLVLGMAIGLEREVSDKAAGLRTNIFIALGATLFTIISAKLQALADPARIAAQVVTGIGFLGAGSIMREGDRVTGLTTAATIWTVAAIGMAVGFGYYKLASVAAAGTLFVQLFFTRLDILIDDLRERNIYRIVSRLDAESLEAVDRVFRESRVRVMRRKVMKRAEGYYLEFYTSGSRAAQERVTQKLLDSKGILEVTY